MERTKEPGRSTARGSSADPPLPLRGATCAGDAFEHGEGARIASPVGVVETSAEDAHSREGGGSAALVRKSLFAGAKTRCARNPERLPIPSDRKAL